MRGPAGVRQEDEKFAYTMKRLSRKKKLLITKRPYIAVENNSNMNVFKNLQWLCLASLAFFGLASIPAHAADSLKPGDAAPDFSLPGSDGKTYKLSDFKGKQAAALARLPKTLNRG